MEILYIILNLLIINFVIVYIIDYSGILLDLSKFLYTISGREWKYQIIKKPFGCSICMTWWISLIYLLFNIGFIYSIGIAATSSILSVLISKMIGKILELFNKI